MEDSKLRRDALAQMTVSGIHGGLYAKLESSALRGLESRRQGGVRRSLAIEDEVGGSEMERKTSGAYSQPSAHASRTISIHSRRLCERVCQWATSSSDL